MFVCQGRAVANGRLAPGRFSDPVAIQLLTAAELAVVTRARAEGLPKEGPERFLVEAVRACAEVMVPRTVLIDDLLVAALAPRHAGHGVDPDLGAREAPAAAGDDPERHGDPLSPAGAGTAHQVVLLGAGLDARPWRLAALAGSRVFSVDHPASQADMRRRSANVGEPVCDLRWVPVDLEQDPLGPMLASAGHDASLPTIWIWEGVVQYLTEADVTASLAAMARLSAPGSSLVVNYRTPSVAASLGRMLSGLFARISRVEDVLADEPWRSAFTPERLGALLVPHGFCAVQHEHLLDTARAIGTPTTRPRSLAATYVTRAIR